MPRAGCASSPTSCTRCRRDQDDDDSTDTSGTYRRPQAAPAPPPPVTPATSAPYPGQRAPPGAFPGMMFDAAARLPLLDSTRTRTELGWLPEHDAAAVAWELLTGLREGAGAPIPPVTPDPAVSAMTQLRGSGVFSAGRRGHPID
jgi:hypothetical protein